MTQSVVLQQITDHMALHSIQARTRMVTVSPLMNTIYGYINHTL